MSSDPRSRLESIMLDETTTIRQAMEAIGRGAVEIALVSDAERHLFGTVSDGDIRRALLAGARLDDALGPHVARDPHVVRESTTRAEVLDLMRARTLSQIPVLDDEGRVVGLHVLNEVLGAVERPNWAVIMAGGKGTRLGDLTRSIPKPMLPVAGRPILERLVLHLVGSGIRRVLLSINYLGEMIEEHFGDGSDFGCRIDYLREEPQKPLGTAGSLALIRDLEDAVEDPIIVMNGDLITDFSVHSMLTAHRRAQAKATVAVRQYSHEVPFGVIDEEDGKLLRLVEKPAVRWQINAGIYCLEPAVLDRVRREEVQQLPELIEDCLERGEHVCVWQSDDEWQDIGRPAELRRARGQS